MYKQFYLDQNHQLNGQALNFQKCIIGGNWAMILSLGIILVCIAATFVYDHYLSLNIQIAAHISTMIFAGVFKLAYVIRCVGVHGLGFKVF